MTILGNIFLALATLIFLLFGISVFGKEPPRGGDGLMGYAWGIIIFYLLFLGCMTVVAIAIAWKGGFDWISPSKGTQFMLVAIGLLTAVITAAMSLFFKNEPGPFAGLAVKVAGIFPVLIPVFLIASGGILLNDGLRQAVPVAAYKIPLIAVFCIGVLGTGIALIAWMVESNKNEKRRVEGILEDQDRNHQRMLDEVDSCDVSQNMVFILVFTDANHDAGLREKAVAKVKTNPKWQQELIRLLECDWAPSAFNFLASNEVDDKSLFLEPVKKGVLNQAKLIRESIRRSSHPSHFYPELFSWELERVLRTVDRFDGMGVDYRPALRELRAALDEPSEVKKIKLNCEATLDLWIKKHQ